MSFLIAAIFVLTLLWGEFFSPTESAGNPIAISFQVVTLAFMSPLFAVLQMWIARTRHCEKLPGSWLPRFRLMLISHLIVWSIISICIVSIGGWYSFAKSASQPEIIPLVDEIILLLPALFGLISSWAIFIYGSPEGSLSTRRTPKDIFSLWLRMKVVMIATPVLFAFFVADALRISIHDNTALAISLTLWIAIVSAITLCVICYPRILLLIWNTVPLADPSRIRRIDGLFRDSNLKPRKVHVWNTGYSVANAAAIGIVPGSEVIVVSDLLLEHFSDEEIDAIVLHEIGHIKKHHCIRRIAMVLGPLALLAFDQSLSAGFHAAINNSQFANVILGPATAYLPAIGFLLYLLVITRVSFRNMEHEADQFALESSLHSGTSISIDTALQKLSMIFPQQLHRRSGLHPSIAQRLAFAVQTRANFFRENQSDKLQAKPAISTSLDRVAAK